MDTPGHFHFDRMRENSAIVADAVLLVVAADEGLVGSFNWFICIYIYIYIIYIYIYYIYIHVSCFSCKIILFFVEINGLPARSII